MPEEDITYPWMEVTGDYQFLNMGAGSKTGPLQEQQAILTADPSLQPLKSFKFQV